MFLQADTQLIAKYKRVFFSIPCVVSWDRSQLNEWCFLYHYQLQSIQLLSTGRLPLSMQIIPSVVVREACICKENRSNNSFLPYLAYVIGGV